MMPLDVASWKLEVLEREQFAPPTVRLRDQRAVSNSGLADCVRNHRYLKPVELDAGESGMPLLLLWQVDHGLAFPGEGGAGSASVLVGLTRRLKAQVQADAELRQWLTCQEMQRALAPGLPATHHLRWSVRVVALAPAEPQGWYHEFARCWHVHMALLAQPMLASPSVFGDPPPTPPTATTSSGLSVAPEFVPVPMQEAWQSAVPAPRPAQRRRNAAYLASRPGCRILPAALRPQAPLAGSSGAPRGPCSPNPTAGPGGAPAWHSATGCPLAAR